MISSEFDEEEFRTPCHRCPKQRLEEALRSSCGQLVLQANDLHNLLQEGWQMRLADVPADIFYVSRLISRKQQQHEERAKQQAEIQKDLQQQLQSR